MSHHPRTRAERRHQRDRVIVARRFVYQKVWRMDADDHKWPAFVQWGRYAKWNLGCGSPGCHREKYFGPKRKRREALKHAGNNDFQTD